MEIKPPKNSSDLKNFADTVWIYFIDTWKPQITVKNCNKISSWKLLTEKRESKFHCLERKESAISNNKIYYMYKYTDQSWEKSYSPDFIVNLT